MREMRSDYSEATLQDVICYAAACLGNDDAAMRTWGTRTQSATAQRIVALGLFDRLACRGSARYAVAMLQGAVTDAAKNSAGPSKSLLSQAVAWIETHVLGWKMFPGPNGGAK